MHIRIDITQDDDGKHRVDVYDWDKSKFIHKTEERLIDAVGIAENYLAEIQIFEYHKIKNAWSF